MASFFKLEKVYQYIDYIFPLYFIITFFDMYLGNIGIYIYVKYLSFIILLIYGAKIYINCPNYKGMKSIFTLFLLFNLFSVVWYAVNGVTFRCYINELFNSIPAMFFFYIGMSERRNDDRFFRYFLYGCTVCMLIGFYLYLTMPGWYITSKTALANNQWYVSYSYNENDISSAMRFSSYLTDTYEADVYAIFAFGIALSFYYNNRNFYGKKLSYIFIFVNLLAAIMTQQRVAMAAVTSYLIFFIFWGYFNKKKKESSKLVFIISLLLLLLIPIVIMYFADRVDIIVELLTGRIENMSMSKAIGERNYQLKLLTDHWGNPILGYGIGSGGSIARYYGHPGVHDCSYIEMLYEIGIVGFLFYFYILLKTSIRGIKLLRYYITELCMIGFVVVACIGSNTLTMGFLAICPFWYCMGRIWNPYLLNSRHMHIVTQVNI